MRVVPLALILLGLVTTVYGISTPTPFSPKVLEEISNRAAEPAPVSTPEDPQPTNREDRPLIQFAICLDTSGSMKGLIDSARQKLWAITNELALAEPTPRLEVALLTFGNDGHNPESGWVAKHLDFTEDLDSISQLLFSFVTNGGTELVGRVLQAADQQLSWSEKSETLKLVFVAGNESADQDGQVPFRDAAATLIARDIQVSSIYCGPAEDGVAPGWREVALRGEGHFASIDQNTGTLTIATPFDAEITRLGTLLNDTYIPYGSAGLAGVSNQRAQDWNASNLNHDAAASRASCKATSNYFCSWDLVDMVREKQIEVTKIVITDLPEKMRTMTIEEVITIVETKQEKRSEIQAKIQALTAKRQAFIEQEMAKRELNEENAFDTAVRRAIRERAKAKGFTFPSAPVRSATVQAPMTPAAAGAVPVNAAPSAPAQKMVPPKILLGPLKRQLDGETDSGC